MYNHSYFAFASIIVRLYRYYKNSNIGKCSTRLTFHVNICGYVTVTAIINGCRCLFYDYIHRICGVCVLLLSSGQPTTQHDTIKHK